MIEWKKLSKGSSQSVIVALLLVSCSQNQALNNSNQENDNHSSAENQGVLTLVANGEDFVRQGFVSKDGWRIDFTHVYITLADVVAYQTEPPFNAQQEDELHAKKSVTLVTDATTVDLAEGDENASPILVTQVNAPTGIYNALSWKVTNNEQQPASIVLEGRANRDGQTINFNLSLARTLDYACGEYVGDERKGIVSPEAPAEVETTFHFDHLFGDAETSAEETLNLDALGFEPLATLAENGQLQVDMTTLGQKLSPEDYGKLEKAVSSLGHVGEGHCREVGN